MRHDCDILISGGGIAGLTAAAAFGREGFRVICVDPALPVTEAEADGADLRTTAFLQPARAFLDRAGVWNRLAPHATPLQVMRVVNDCRDGTGVACDFDAADISDQPFGWNLPNWLLRRELTAALEGMETVEFRPGTGTATRLARSRAARIGLSDGSRIDAKLVIAADGRGSPMRQAAGIGVRTTRFGQKALAFAVTHPEPHNNVSTEIHRSGGPFTLVPLPDRDGTPCSAVVWMEDAARAETLAGMETHAFEAEMTARSGGILGPLSLASRRALWPIVMQTADRLTAERLALVAEAAHVLPPIGAQGLNTSLRDLDTLLDLARDHREDPGAPALLDAYERARAPDIRLRSTGIGLLNRVSQTGEPTLAALRGAGLQALHGIAPVRRSLMRLGLGAAQ